MGAIWCKKGELISSTGEIVGYKSGLALSIEQLKFFTLDGYEDIFAADQNRTIRIRAEEYEMFLAHILYKLGVISTDNIASFIIILFHKYKEEEKALATFLEQALGLYTFFEKELEEMSEKSFIPFPSVFENKNIMEAILHIATTMIIFIQKRVEENEFNFRKELFRTSVLKCNQYKRDEILEAFLVGLTDYVQRSPWIQYQSVQWKDRRELSDLFNSEQLHSCHGEYFDQRFINYLSSQYNDIGDIHWRQFEGLAGEFLYREGFVVEMGTGRNDDNIDIRAWKEKATEDTPPTILVQCKRQKNKVGKVIVKALWADIEYEKAQSGLIVTSSALEPGAQKTQVARAYPITEINRATLKNWILKMRTPWTGIFLSE
jgi:restriction system protein